MERRKQTKRKEDSGKNGNKDRPNEELEKGFWREKEKEDRRYDRENVRAILFKNKAYVEQ